MVVGCGSGPWVALIGTSPPITGVGVGGCDRAGVEHRPQRLVPGGDVGQCGSQRVRVVGLVRPQGERVVGRRAVRARGQVPLPPPALRRGERSPGVGARPMDRLRAGLPRGTLEQLREPAHRRRVEHLAHRQVGAELGADPPDQPHHGHRVPAQVEETVVDADLGQVQDLGEQVGQPALPRRGRPPGACQCRPVRRGQGPLVQLAVGGQRQRPVENEHDRGHHVLRQPVRDVRAQRGRIRRGPLGGRRVPDQPHDVAVPIRQHGRLRDVVVARPARPRPRPARSGTRAP